MIYSKAIDNGYIVAIMKNAVGDERIDKEEYERLFRMLRSRPAEPDGYAYMLRADTMDWELVERPEEAE